MKLFPLVIGLIFLSVPNPILGRSRSRDRLPIQEEEARQNTLLSQVHNKASECRFADQRYELEETWHPDLGQPFGIMYCVHCECVPIHKKRRIVGRVRCKNIKTECPKVKCRDPILLPGRCCKVCPGETENPDLMIEVNLKKEEEEKNGRHYAALLMPSRSAREMIPNDETHVATGRFFFRKKTLTYSFVISDDFGLAKLISFLDNEGNIIEEFPLFLTSYQKTSGKSCGSWHRVPRRYRRQLRRDEIYVQLTNEDGITISGRVGKFYGLSSELFSGLALGNQGSNSAATAILSMTSQGGTGSVHVNLLVRGLFPEDGQKNLPIEVKFQWSRDGRPEEIVEDLVIPKVDDDLTSIDFKTVFDEPVLEELGRGRVLFNVSTRENKPRFVQGVLAPRFTCDMFDSVLSTSDLEENDIAQNTIRQPTFARGMAWMIMSKSGHLQYFIRLSNLSRNVVSIQMDNGRKSRRLLRVVEDFAPFFRYDDIANDSRFKSGWANGTLQLSASDIEDLYHSNLYINVGTIENDLEIRGRVLNQLLEPAHELAVHPILISDDISRTPQPVVALAWVNVDRSCKLNYNARLSSVDKTSESKLFLKDYPMKNLKASTLVPIRTWELQEFYGADVSGSQDRIHKLSMARLDSGDASLVIQHFGDYPYTIEGRILGIHPPADCLPSYSRNHLEVMPGFLNDLGEEKPDIDPEIAFKCIYEGKPFNNGDQWPSTHESCKMCSCIKGVVKCDDIICPRTNCTNPIVQEGECCPSCLSDLPAGNIKSCWFEGDKQFHTAGTKWHPYIPPWGFNRCVTCVCKADNLQVECLRKSCPSLSCPLHQQVKADALSCCKTCDETIGIENDEESDQGEEEGLAVHPDQPHDMGVEKTKQDVIDSGGCLWRDDVVPNGAVWHPRVLPYGRLNCVSCNCKDGQSSCQKVSCTKLNCRYQLKDKDMCCPRCAVTSAEIKAAKREVRLHRIRQLRRNRRIRHHHDRETESSEAEEHNESLAD